MSIGRFTVLAALLSLALAGSATAHGQGSGLTTRQGAAVAPPAGVAAPRAALELRGCWMTVAFVPRPAAALEPPFLRPLDLSRTFYGPDPLLGVWALRCDRARTAGLRVRGAILSLIGVPLGLTDAQAPPLANFFAHALLRLDASSPALARALRRLGLPAHPARGARYRHSRPGVSPSTGELAVPGRYRLGVSASRLDPTNPHDHVNRFEYRGRGGRVATAELRSGRAFDRFCFPAPGEPCSATVGAPRATALGDLLGAGSARARVGFDHARLARVELSVRRGFSAGARRP